MDENKVTIEMIEEKKRIWDEYKERTDMHGLIKVMAVDMWINLMYEDITTKWNEEHAQILMHYFDRAFRYAGIK